MSYAFGSDIPASQRRFTVTADWLDACGKPTDVQTFDVVRLYKRGPFQYADLSTPWGEFVVNCDWRGTFEPSADEFETVLAQFSEAEQAGIRADLTTAGGTLAGALEGMRSVLAQRASDSVPHVAIDYPAGEPDSAGRIVARGDNWKACAEAAHAAGHEYAVFHKADSAAALAAAPRQVTEFRFNAQRAAALAAVEWDAPANGSPDPRPIMVQDGSSRVATISGTHTPSGMRVACDAYRDGETGVTLYRNGGRVRENAHTALRIAAETAFLHLMIAEHDEQRATLAAVRPDHAQLGTIAKRTAELAHGNLDGSGLDAAGIVIATAGLAGRVRIAQRVARTDALEAAATPGAMIDDRTVSALAELENTPQANAARHTANAEQARIAGEYRRQWRGPADNQQEGEALDAWLARLPRVEPSYDPRAFTVFGYTTAVPGCGRPVFLAYAPTRETALDLIGTARQQGAERVNIQDNATMKGETVWPFDNRVHIVSGRCIDGTVYLNADGGFGMGLSNATPFLTEGEARARMAKAIIENASRSPDDMTGCIEVRTMESGEFAAKVQAEQERAEQDQSDDPEARHWDFLQSLSPSDLRALDRACSLAAAMCQDDVDAFTKQGPMTRAQAKECEASRDEFRALAERLGKHSAGIA